VVSDAMQSTVGRGRGGAGPLTPATADGAADQSSSTVQRTPRQRQGRRSGSGQDDPPLVQAEALAPDRSGWSGLDDFNRSLRAAGGPTIPARARCCASACSEGSRRRYASIGMSSWHGQGRHPGAAVKKGDVVRCVVVRTKKEKRPPRWAATSLRRERGGADQRPAAAARHAHLRPGGPWLPRQ